MAQRSSFRGFSIVELLIVIVVIGILATVGILAYGGITGRAVDNAVLSDTETLASLQTDYALENGNGGKDWYSAAGIDTDLQFTPSGGNVIDVVTNSTDYCIRAYNPQSTSYRTVLGGYVKGSSATSCRDLPASGQAVSDSDVLNGTASWKTASMGWLYGCSLDYGGEMYCWPGNPWLRPKGAIGSQPVVKLVDGEDTRCAIAEDARAYCWLSNTNGEVGDGTVTYASSPVAVDTSGVLAGKDLVDIAIGKNHTCAVDTSGSVYCWGLNTDGQLGNGTNTSSTSPVAVNMSGVLAGQVVTKVTAGNAHTCALSESGLAFCWGNNSSGRLGNGSTTFSNVPVAVSVSGSLSGKKITDITSGYYFNCVIADTQAYCWGSGSQGVLGNGAQTSSTTPTPVSTTGPLNGKELVSIETLDRTVCTLSVDSTIACWGLGSFGQIGNGTTTSPNLSPLAVTLPADVEGSLIDSITVGSYSNCLLTKGKLYCWGLNSNGQLGIGGTTNATTPTLILPFNL